MDDQHIYHHNPSQAVANMPLHPVYQRLLEEITDDLQRQILTIFLERPGQRLHREQLVAMIFHKYIRRDQVANSSEDRKIRECIEDLRETWPIVSSSGESGYIFQIEEKFILMFAHEQEDRADKDRRNARRAYGWLSKARTIREAMKTAEVVTQGRLM
jgi:hypothetical protein